MSKSGIFTFFVLGSLAGYLLWNDGGKSFNFSALKSSNWSSSLQRKSNNSAQRQQSMQQNTLSGPLSQPIRTGRIQQPSSRPNMYGARDSKKNSNASNRSFDTYVSASGKVTIDVPNGVTLKPSERRNLEESAKNTNFVGWNGPLDASAACTSNGHGGVFCREMKNDSPVGLRELGQEFKDSEPWFKARAAEQKAKMEKIFAKPKLDPLDGPNRKK